MRFFAAIYVLAAVLMVLNRALLGTRPFQVLDAFFGKTKRHDREAAAGMRFRAAEIKCVPIAHFARERYEQHNFYLRELRIPAERF